LQQLGVNGLALGLERGAPQNAIATPDQDEQQADRHQHDVAPGQKHDGGEKNRQHGYLLPA
jgi:hypothetical protein